MQKEISIIIPAKNEALTLGPLLQRLTSLFPETEVIIVDDGSTDDTSRLAEKANATVVSLPYSMGNGAAIKSGARAASGDIYIFMDADGQHSPEDINDLLNEMTKGYDMVVGARSNKSHTNIARLLANKFYNFFSSWVSGHKIEDLTSGFRAVRADKFREFIYLLPNGFSYPTTITMAMFRAGYKIKYTPIHTMKRTGNSHIRPLVDGIRFLMIIFKIGTLYTPLKLFLPISIFFFLSGLGYYAYTYISQERFTNMGVLLFITSLLIFIIGLISEQLTVLLYSHTRNYHNRD